MARPLSIRSGTLSIVIALRRSHADGLPVGHFFSHDVFCLARTTRRNYPLGRRESPLSPAIKECYEKDSFAAKMHEVSYG